MNKPRFYRFVAGSLIAIAAETDFSREVAAASQYDESRDRRLSDLGLVMTENYGSQNEVLGVWKHDVMGWFIEYHDTADHVMGVFITDPADFLEFQARYVAPIAMKILAAEPYIKEQNVLADKEYTFLNN